VAYEKGETYLHLNHLQPPPSIFYVIFLFFLFLPLWLLQSVLAFFGFAFSQHDHIVEFCAHVSVHRESMLECSNKMTLLYSILFPANRAQSFFNLGAG
jgi:cellulose synthase/poly-beta-1,6-N-acetylglucosamine synthase-like glycosyltransferase